MLGGKMKRVCTICARGGSKGIGSKNTRMLLGKPLIAHSVEHAQASGLFDEIAVSSDSEEILAAAAAAGVTQLIKRPDALATDTSDKSPAIFHAAMEVERLTGLRFDTFVDLDATAPLRLPVHIKEAVAAVESGAATNVLSVCESRRSPYFNMVELTSDGTPGLCKTVEPAPVRRQDVPPTFDMNASIYVWNRGAFVDSEAGVLLPRTRAYVMPDFTGFDIDGRFDFQLIEFIYPRLRELNDADD